MPGLRYLCIKCDYIIYNLALNRLEGKVGPYLARFASRHRWANQCVLVKVVIIGEKGK